jgi:hypothetical protein
MARTPASRRSESARTSSLTYPFPHESSAGRAAKMPGRRLVGVMRRTTRGLRPRAAMVSTSVTTRNSKPYLCLTSDSTRVTSLGSVITSAVPLPLLLRTPEYDGFEYAALPVNYSVFIR